MFRHDHGAHSLSARTETPKNLDNPNELSDSDTRSLFCSSRCIWVPITISVRQYLEPPCSGLLINGFDQKSTPRSRIYRADAMRRRTPTSPLLLHARIISLRVTQHLKAKFKTLNLKAGLCLSMMEQVRLCAIWPMENWLGSSLNQIQGWTTVRESYSPALEQGPLLASRGPARPPDGN